MSAPPAFTARDERDGSKAWNAMVMPKPASATSFDHALSIRSTFQGDWSEADWTTTPGAEAAMASPTVSAEDWSTARVSKVAGVPKMAARALPACASHVMRSRLRPPMVTRTGARAVAARSLIMISAK